MSIQLFTMIIKCLLPAGTEGVAEHTGYPPRINPTTHPIESEEELCSSDPVIPTSDDVLDEETSGE